jgi:hypothetical protein
MTDSELDVKIINECLDILSDYNEFSSTVGSLNGNDVKGMIKKINVKLNYDDGNANERN